MPTQEGGAAQTPIARIQAELALQSRFWRIQRAGWAAFAAIVVLAVAGVFGPGVLIGQTRAGNPASGLWIEYPRFARYDSPMTIAIHVDRRHAIDDLVRVTIDKAYLQYIDIENISPAPVSSAVSTDGAVLAFDVIGGPGDLRIAYRLRARGLGGITGRMGLAGRDDITFTQWIHP